MQRVVATRCLQHLEWVLQNLEWALRTKFELTRRSLATGISVQHYVASRTRQRLVLRLTFQRNFYLETLPVLPGGG